MSPDELKHRNFESELTYSASRSGGPGGQNVNKVSTKVELRINIILSSILTENEKSILIYKLRNKISKDGELILVSQSERTQLLNKSEVTEKFFELVSKALTLPLKRKSTRPTLISKIKRLEEKQTRGKIKKLRRKSGESFEG